MDKKFYDFSEINYSRTFEERALLPFKTLNKMVGGLELGEISIIGGETGSGKTTFISQCILEIIQSDKVLCIYGESTLEKQAAQIYRQMTPFCREDYEKKTYFKNDKETDITQWFVSELAEVRVKSITKGKLFFYDTTKGMDIKSILDAIKIAHEHGINYFLLDNLMQIETSTSNEVKEIKDYVEDLRRYVIENKIHLVIVAHYRKSQDYTMIRRRLEDILGTSAIGNKCATAFNIIRLDNVVKETYSNGKSTSNKGWLSLKELVSKNGYDIDQCDAVIEVLKTRFNKLGFVGLKFNKAQQTFTEVKRNDEFNDDKSIVESESKEEKKLFFNQDW